MRIKSTLVLIVLFALSLVFNPRLSFASASGPHWEFAGWYGGGFYPAVEFSNSDKNTVYLTSDVGGIWKSKNLGGNWQCINRGLGQLSVYCLAISASRPELIYAGTKEGLFVSRNGGGIWRKCHTLNGKIAFERSQSRRSIALAPQSPETVYVGTAGGSVFYSGDYGQNWKTLSKEHPLREKKPITALALTPDGKFLFAASASGLARYSFENRHWQVLKPGELAPVRDLLILSKSGEVMAAGKNVLFISPDTGQHWMVSKPLPVSGALINSISVYESEDNTLLACAWEKDWKGGVMLSRSKGMEWSAADADMFADTHANPTRLWAKAGGRTASVRISPFSPEIILRTDWWGVWRSDNGGVSWKEKIRGAPNTVGSDIVFDSTNNLYVAAMDNGLYKSRDGGKSYEAVFPAQKFQKNLHGHIWRVLILDKKGEHIVATSSPWEEDVNQVVLTTDGGKNFEIIRRGLAQNRSKKGTVWHEGYPRALARDPKNPNQLYLGIDGEDGGGLFISRDAGRSWKRSEGQPDSKAIYNGLAVDPFDSSRIFWAACGQKGGVYLSEDGGNSWKLIFSEMKWIFDMAVAGDGTLYISGSGKGNRASLYISKNRGRDWRLLFGVPEAEAMEAIALHPQNPDTLAVSTEHWCGRSGGGIFLTQNGGKTWKEITGNLPQGTGAAAMTFSPNGSYLYLSRFAGSVYRTKVGN
ncbi:MAG: hypothetical protein HY586_07375 [Candidatus Omnitrophica bacterium]|nr:hypothetical protein [Candidatus Omnitrophota bacterium]